MQDFDVFLLVDSDGASSVGDSEQAARDQYEEVHGALNECAGFRIVRVTVRASLPAVVEKCVTVDGDEATVTV